VTTRLRTRFLPGIPSKRTPGRIRVYVIDGPDEGRHETFNYHSLDYGAGFNAHERAADRMLLLLGLSGEAVLVDSSNAGDVFVVEE
jgi:hypothetical protein